MLNEIKKTDAFYDYYEKWIAVYKKGAVRDVTLDKYHLTYQWIGKLAPDLKLCELNRISYQQLLNDYAEYHERQTTMDFHHQLKGQFWMLLMRGYWNVILREKQSLKVRLLVLKR